MKVPQSHTKTPGCRDDLPACLFGAHTPTHRPLPHLSQRHLARAQRHVPEDHVLVVKLHGRRRWGPKLEGGLGLPPPRSACGTGAYAPGHTATTTYVQPQHVVSGDVREGHRLIPDGRLAAICTTGVERVSGMAGRRGRVPRWPVHIWSPRRALSCQRRRTCGGLGALGGLIDAQHAVRVLHERIAACHARVGRPRRGPSQHQPSPAGGRAVPNGPRGAPQQDLGGASCHSRAPSPACLRAAKPEGGRAQGGGVRGSGQVVVRTSRVAPYTSAPAHTAP